VEHDPDPREEKILARFRTLTNGQQKVLTFTLELGGTQGMTLAEAVQEMGVARSGVFMHKKCGLKNQRSSELT